MGDRGLAEVGFLLKARFIGATADATWFAPSKTNGSRWRWEPLRSPHCFGLSLLPLDQDSSHQMSSIRSAASLVAVGILFACAPVARSDEWVSCKRDARGQLLWLRGKSTERLENTAFRPGSSHPDLGTCLVSKDQLRQAHGLKF